MSLNKRSLAHGRHLIKENPEAPYAFAFIFKIQCSSGWILVANKRLVNQIKNINMEITPVAIPKDAVTTKKMKTYKHISYFYVLFTYHHFTLQFFEEVRKH